MTFAGRDLSPDPTSTKYSRSDATDALEHESHGQYATAVSASQASIRECNGEVGEFLLTKVMQVQRFQEKMDTVVVVAGTVGNTLAFCTGCQPADGKLVPNCDDRYHMSGPEIGIVDRMRLSFIEYGKAPFAHSLRGE